MNKIAWPLLLCTLLLLQSCNRKFLGFDFSPKDELKIDSFDFEYFSSKAKFKFESGNDKTRATANIRVKKDSIIWMNLTPGVGIQAARIKITRDSLVMIDNINKNVLRYSFETLSNEFNFDIDFDLIQSVIIGDLPIARNSRDIVAEEVDHFLMTQKRDELNIENTIGLNTRKLEKLTATSTQTQNSLDINYEDFKLVDEYAFPHKALILLKYFKDGENQSINIDIEHNRTQIEKKPLKFPFNIPKRYERK